MSKNTKKILYDPNSIGLTNMKSLVDSIMGTTENRYEHTQAYLEDISIIASYFKARPTEITLLKINSKLGINLLALSVVKNQKSEDKNIVIYTQTLTKEEIVSNLIFSEADVEKSKYLTGTFNEKDFAPLVNNSVKLSKLKLFIDDSKSITISEIKDRIRILSKTKEISLIAIECSSFSKSLNENEIEKIQTEIESLALELNISVFLFI